MSTDSSGRSFRTKLRERRCVTGTRRALSNQGSGSFLEPPPIGDPGAIRTGDLAVMTGAFYPARKVGFTFAGTGTYLASPTVGLRLLQKLDYSVELPTLDRRIDKN